MSAFPAKFQLFRAFERFRRLLRQGSSFELRPIVDSVPETDRLDLLKRFLNAERKHRAEHGHAFSADQYLHEFSEYRHQIDAHLQRLDSPAALAMTGSSPAGIPFISGYNVRRELGQGASGIVYEAIDTKQQSVAIKVYSNTRFDLARRERFESEMALIFQLSHPSIVTAKEKGDWKGIPYLVMELIPGGQTLRQLVGVVTPRQAALLLVELADAVHYAHSKNVLHRDLKPDNVLVVAQIDGSYQVKLADFGSVKAMDDTRNLTMLGAQVGTLAYAAPEQLAASETADPRSDIYGLGAVLYELLTGKPPFTGPTIIRDRMAGRSPTPIRELRPQVPEELALICEKCLQLSPEHRYPTAAALAVDLRLFTEDKPLKFPSGRTDSPQRTELRPVMQIPRSFSQKLRAAVIVGCLLIVGGLTVKTLLLESVLGIPDIFAEYVGLPHRLQTPISLVFWFAIGTYAGWTGLISSTIIYEYRQFYAALIEGNRSCIARIVGGVAFASFFAAVSFFGTIALQFVFGGPERVGEMPVLIRAVAAFGIFGAVIGFIFGLPIWCFGLWTREHPVQWIGFCVGMTAAFGVCAFLCLRFLSWFSLNWKKPLVELASKRLGRSHCTVF